jgi:hypothetical protein
MARRHVAVAGALTLAALAVGASPALGHQPSIGSKQWTDAELAGGVSTFKWNADVPGWLKPVVEFHLEDSWDNLAKNNSDGIAFLYSSAGQGAVKFRDSSGTCPGTAWLGCANSNTGRDWDIWFKETVSINGSPALWCQDPDNTSSQCWNVGRIGVHEVLHIAGSLADVEPAQWMSESNSVMRNPPVGPGTSDHVGYCDHARLQMWYDVATLYGGYPDCYHELADTNTDGSLKVELSAAPSVTTACSGSSVTVGGRLNIDNYDSYERIGGNNLAQRTVKLIRSGTTHVGTDVSNGTANPDDNWSLSTTFTTSVNVTLNYHASHTSTAPAIGSKTSPSFTITWIKPSLC